MKQKNNTIIIQGAILAAAGLLTKVIGFLYRIPMANLLGEEGNGIYSVSFGIYNVALTLSSYSFPLAVSKLVSARLASGHPKRAYNTFFSTLLLSIIAGLCSFSILFFGADFLQNLYQTEGLAYPLKVLAPTTFAVALLGVFRGWFQGHTNMVPTALSQIFEQILNAVVSIAATYWALKIYDNEASHGAAGATMGTLAGALCALTFMVLVFMSRLPYTKKLIKQDICTPEATLSLWKEMLLTMLPIIISQTIYQISFTLDDLLFSNALHSRGITGREISSLQGVFNTQYTQLINIPLAVASAMAASTLPGIVKLSVEKKYSERRSKIQSIIKINAVVAIPCAVALAVLAEPIVTILFPGLVTYRHIAIGLLRWGSSGCIFYALSTVTTSILQGCGRMRIPVVNAFMSFIVHTLTVALLFNFTPLGIWARLIGDVTFPLMIALLNFLQLKKKFGFIPKLKKAFFVPFLSSLAMGGVSAAIYYLLHALGLSIIAAFAVSAVTAVLIYVFLVLKFSVFDDSELDELPAGGKIKKLSSKIKSL